MGEEWDHLPCLNQEGRFAGILPIPRKQYSVGLVSEVLSAKQRVRLGPMCPPELSTQPHTGPSGGRREAWWASHHSAPPSRAHRPRGVPPACLGTHVASRSQRASWTPAQYPPPTPTLSLLRPMAEKLTTSLSDHAVRNISGHSSPPVSLLTGLGHGICEVLTVWGRHGWKQEGQREQTPWLWT